VKNWKLRCSGFSLTVKGQKMARVIFPDCTPYMARLLDEETHALLPGLVVDVAKPTPAEFCKRIEGAIGVLHFNTKLTTPMLSACPSLRVIVFLGTGVGSWVDLATAAAQGIRVRNITGYGDRTIAEHTLALIFACARKVGLMDRQIRAGSWQSDALYELQGKTLGLVGLGGIGRAMARLGTALGFNVIGWNRSSVSPAPCQLVPLEEIFAQADIVSVHLALNDATRGLINHQLLTLMKPSSIFINTARGALVDEVALIERLASKGIAAAGLDVYQNEPLSITHPLIRLDNAVLTAHSAWMSPEAGRRLLRIGFAAMRSELDALDRAQT
jgi:D-3-phosphoglycerate dehydrogenase / 2-oxoglutarate reductase